MGKGVSEFFLRVEATVRTGAVMVGQMPFSARSSVYITSGALMDACQVRPGWREPIGEPVWAATTRVPSGVPKILLVHKHDDYVFIPLGDM